MNPDIEAAKAMFESGDYAAAIPILQELAATEHAEAMGLIGLAHQLGFGVPRDSGLAEEFLRRASERGHGASAHNLGTLFVSDLAGAPDALIHSASSYLRAESLGFVVADKSFYDNQRAILKSNGA